MSIDAKKVLVGAPDQSSTTGAVNVAPLGTTLPTDAAAALSGFTPCGYVSEDGVSLAQDYSTNDIKDWSRSTVRSLLDEFTGEVSWTFIQTGYDELCAIFGADHVTRVLADATHGERIDVKIGAHLAEPKCFVFNMKDGDARVRVVLPNAQPVPDGDLTFKANEPISWGCKLTCNADEDGESIYVYTDDGVKASASTTTTTTTTGA